MSARTLLRRSGKATAFTLSVAAVAALILSLVYLFERAAQDDRAEADNRARDQATGQTIEKQQTALQLLEDQVKGLGGTPVVEIPGPREPAETPLIVRPSLPQSEFQRAVAVFCRDGRCRGPGPNDQQVTLAVAPLLGGEVASYCNERNECRGADGSTPAAPRDGKDGGLGPIGPVGPAGPLGPAGRGVERIDCIDGQFVARYTDSTSQTISGSSCALLTPPDPTPEPTVEPSPGS